MTDKGTQEDKD